MDDVTELAGLVRQVRGQVQRAAERGVSRVPAPPPRAPAPRLATELDAIRADLGDCTRCKLHPTRKNIVFGVGNPHADLVFIGEAPGANEDLQGEPFVGEAGQLLTKMIAAMGWGREDVYIANILKCLRYNVPVLLENGSWERIGRLVRGRYAGKVMSIAEDGRIVPRRVIGWHTSPLGDRRVYRLSYASAKRVGAASVGTYLTHDHEVLTRRGYVRAEDLRGDDEVAVGQGLSRVAREVITGSLLGDGTLARSSSYFAFIHCRDQDEWVRLKADALKELCPIVYHGTSRATRDGQPHLTTIGRTRASRALRIMRSRFYPGGRKTVPADLALTPLVLAMWFLDDGYTKIESERSALSEIACHSFTSDEIARLVAFLKRDLGLEGYVRESSPGRIHFGAAASAQVGRMIAPYCPPCLRYKLHPSALSIPFDRSLYEHGERETDYDRVCCEEVPFTGTDRTFFCLDVEQSHNFVTAGGVVHNCRPPGNRNPEADEIAKCEPFLIRQLAAIKPRMIVALGKFAAQCLLRKPDTPISALRGKFHQYQGIPVMPTYHPAYLLRTPSAKRQVWDDLQLVMAELERLGIRRG